MTTLCNNFEAKYDEVQKISNETCSLSLRYQGYEIQIQQEQMRTIRVTSEEDVELSEIYAICTAVEKLLMVFEGRFYPLQEVRIYKNDLRLEDSEKRIQSRRLACFESHKLYKYPDHILVNFPYHLNSLIFEKWVQLLDELDIVFTVFLYMTSTLKLPTDISNAYLIELCESFFEILEKPKLKLKPKSKMNLRMYIDNMIKTYGKDIFDAERENKAIYEYFLDALRDSRVRIMHITHKKHYLSGEACNLYSVKLYFLYRKIILSHLGIEYCIYQDKLKSVIKEWEKWENIHSDFLKILKER